jgi:hypothetical protein
MLPSSQPARWRREDRRTRARSTGMGDVLTKKGSPTLVRRRRHSVVIRRGSCFPLNYFREAKLDSLEQNPTLLSLPEVC